MTRLGVIKLLSLDRQDLVVVVSCFYTLLTSVFLGSDIYNSLLGSLLAGKKIHLILGCFGRRNKLDRTVSGGGQLV